MRPELLCHDTLFTFNLPVIDHDDETRRSEAAEDRTPGHRVGQEHAGHGHVHRVASESERAIAHESGRALRREGIDGGLVAMERDHCPRQEPETRTGSRSGHGRRSPVGRLTAVEPLLREQGQRRPSQRRHPAERIG